MAVLTAIAIPVFTSQMEKSREATDLANLRSAYAALMTQYLEKPDKTQEVTVPAKQTIFDAWTVAEHKIGTKIGSFASEIEVEAPKSATGWKVTIEGNTGKLEIKAQ